MKYSHVNVIVNEFIIATNCSGSVYFLVFCFGVSSFLSFVLDQTFFSHCFLQKGSLPGQTVFNFLFIY